MKLDHFEETLTLNIRPYSYSMTSIEAKDYEISIHTHNTELTWVSARVVMVAESILVPFYSLEQARYKASNFTLSPTDNDTILAQLKPNEFKDLFSYWLLEQLPKITSQISLSIQVQDLILDNASP